MVESMGPKIVGWTGWAVAGEFVGWIAGWLDGCLVHRTTRVTRPACDLRDWAPHWFVGRAVPFTSSPTSELAIQLTNSPFSRLRRFNTNSPPFISPAPTSVTNSRRAQVA